MTEPYYKYSEYLKQKYGTKTYKLTVNLPLTCPNRDGFLSSNGCLFCGEEVTGDTVSPDNVRQQLSDSKGFIAERYGADKFIAYFQSYSNTYLPLDTLKPLLSKAAAFEDVVEIALGTRPDCINQHYLSEIKDAIDSNQSRVNLTIELGLQTVNYHTLQSQNRGHTLAEFIDAVLTAKKFNVEVCAHLILNLPGDDTVDVIETAKIVSALSIDTVKLHALFIHKNSQLADRYRKGEVDMISVDDYIERVIVFLRHIRPEIAVQRLLGRAPEEETLFVNWGLHWREIHKRIMDEMQQRGVRQGDKFDYLGGKALKKFCLEN